ncbi:GMC family oxidoreductase [Echinimonas agarilytica]|uniref:GMC family oxidoreductase N-terminal domain-containing protein n=1 Tax=Echinimonas agarilytica TaxID=1215918 RepID=A0AA42B6K3_9GAMM|nr:GMC family oxidoreductase N-terminal domain-containing protein [Echinimonas agarilytica]
MQYNYIIVGGGSAGCVLANRLSADANNTVLLLESGGLNDGLNVIVPIGVVQLMRSSMSNWQINSEPEPNLNNRTIYCPRGKGLGGSSAINAMLYIRGQSDDYNHWQALGNKGWGYQDVLPYFLKSQHQERGASLYHATGGDLNVADLRFQHPLTQALIEASQAQGYPLNQDFNGAAQFGVGNYQVTQINGERCSAARAFLTPVQHRSNLTVLTHAHMDKILIKDGKAVGVRFFHNDEKHVAFADREVLLSAGAIHSPQLLMVSGVGDKAMLASHGILCEAHVPGVGKNLQDHVDALVVRQEKTNTSMSLRPFFLLRSVKELWRYWRKRRGLLTTPVAEMAGFIHSSGDPIRPDIQLHGIAAAMDDHGRNLSLLKRHGVSVHLCLLRPKSRGHVALNDADARTPPRVTLNMLSDEDDMRVMVEGVKRVREILSNSEISPLLEGEIFPGEAVQTDGQIAHFIRKKANTIYHPVGTCKMGNDAMAVVDHELKVRGVQSLRVVDASIMPTIVSGNTNAPTIMIAEKAAAMILASNE